MFPIVSLLILNDLISHTPQSRAGSVAYGMMLSEMMGLQAQGLAIPGTSKCWGCKWAGLCNRGFYSIYVILLAVRVCQKILGRHGFHAFLSAFHAWFSPDFFQLNFSRWTLLAFGESGQGWTGTDQPCRLAMTKAPSIWFRLASRRWKRSQNWVIHSYPMLSIYSIP